MHSRTIKAFSVGFVLCLCMGVLFAACDKMATSNADVLTQKRIAPGRKPVTVLVKYAFSIHAFEAAVEEKFPEIDLVQVGNYTRDMGIEEYASRLKNDDLPDLVMTWPLDVGEEYWADCLLDLSAFTFTSKYNLSMLNTIERNGNLYYLPGPAQVRGIVYNKTLFAQQGWKLPQNFDEFVALCNTIDASGIRSLQLGLGNAEVLDTAFVGYGYADCFSSPQDTQWMHNYNQGEGRFAEQFGSALNTFQALIDADILRASDLDITYSDREQMLFTRQCAMVEDSVLMARMGEVQTGTTDEFALMPFFNPNDGGEWARLYMVCYIGMNKHLAEPKNKETYQLAMQLMEYISTPEGQTALMGDTGAMFSSLNGTQPSTVPEIKALVPALKNGNYAIFPQLQNAQTALRAGLAGMVRGDTTVRELCAAVDAQNASPPVARAPVVLGNATADFSLSDTGAFIADSMRHYSGCELALILDNGKDGRYNGCGVSARLYQGEITDVDLGRILPDLKANTTGTLWKVSLTGEALLDTLEHTVTVANNSKGWFYYCSGIRMEYDVAAEPGKRVRKAVLEQGDAIDPAQIYTVAVMDNTVMPEKLLSCEKTDVTIASILEQTITMQKTISPANDSRLKTVPLF